MNFIIFYLNSIQLFVSGPWYSNGPVYKLANSYSPLEFLTSFPLLPYPQRENLMICANEICAQPIPQLKTIPLANVCSLLSWECIGAVGETYFVNRTQTYFLSCILYGTFSWIAFKWFSGRVWNKTLKLLVVGQTVYINGSQTARKKSAYTAQWQSLGKNPKQILFCCQSSFLFCGNVNVYSFCKHLDR